MSKTYYIFRHGETYFSKNKLPYGKNEYTAEILPESHKVIKKISESLRNTQVELCLRSELLRCEQTAKIIESNSDLRFIKEPLLNEFTETEFDDFNERMNLTVEKLKTLKQNHIALCTHGANVAGFKKLLLGEEFHSHDLMFYPRTGVMLVVSEGKIEEIDFN